MSSARNRRVPWWGGPCVNGGTILRWGVSRVGQSSYFRASPAESRPQPLLAPIIVHPHASLTDLVISSSSLPRHDPFTRACQPHALFTAPPLSSCAKSMSSAATSFRMWYALVSPEERLHGRAALDSGNAAEEWLREKGGWAGERSERPMLRANEVCPRELSCTYQFSVLIEQSMSMHASPPPDLERRSHDHYALRGRTLPCNAYQSSGLVPCYVARIRRPLSLVRYTFTSCQVLRECPDSSSSVGKNEQVCTGFKVFSRFHVGEGVRERTETQHSGVFRMCR
ncbi:uncharacterized protein C8Q71DRAFT_376059 [Rhodofomes roseus]|uniref:Uncharacterized protein n=1 Tax=Rhodofomes roseus TaxID=34475 RepID=A0ABQ8K148_9APHY|nr:uncharacterized protein C8Q71DRAFT_376059 [Rhodofomes roseus]KAH9830350.1 hypothetical protein C8Q71DRAFT_376059 [Rhodofomes roseus]